MQPIPMLLALSALLGLAACADGSSEPKAGGDAAYTLGNLRFTPCALPGVGGSEPLHAQCTTVQVAENPDTKAGRTITLKLAWLPADNESAALPDPVFMLAGGPGQSAIDSFPQVAAAFAEVRKSRHVLLLDQRGTGGSHLLACPAPADEDATALSTEDTARQAEACAKTLGEKADLRYYTTQEAVQDLDTVRQAIGAETINLIGISYGTRVAQHYAARYPAHTRTLVLDSVVPKAMPLGGIFARNLDDALALQFAACQKLPDCRDKLGDPRTQLDALLSRLAAAPVNVRYRDADTFAEAETWLTTDKVAGLVRMYAYMPQAAALLPALIHEAHQGRYENLTALAQMLTRQMGDTMAMGMQFSVVCSEDAGSFGPNAADEGTVLGQQLSAHLGAACSVWPQKNMPDGFHAPLAGNVPVLAISGEFDPVTPPRYGDDVVKPLGNARHLVLKGQGHNVMGAGCMPKLFAQFLDHADPAALDASCLENLAPVPPFTSFNGWNP